MNIAIIKQSGGKYLFEVPESITLKEGEKVKCDTRRGVTDGIVWADSITADEPAAKLIGKLLGAKFPLKSVVGKTVTSIEMFEQPEQPKQEPVKLYCVEDCSGFTTKGKIYEFTDGDIRLDDGTHCAGWFTDYADFVSDNRSIAACLVPLVSRPAKVGEFIRNNSTGEVCEVIALSFGKNAYVRTKVGNKKYDGDCADRKIEHPFDLWGKTNYLVLDGYKPEPEKAEPEYYSGKVVCVEATDAGVTLGKVYSVENGVFTWNNGEKSDTKATTIEQFNNWFIAAKFIEFKGE